MSNANLHALISPMITGGSLIWADQNGPRPPKPYSTIRIRTAVPHSPWTLEPDANGVASLIQIQSLTVEVECFGRGALDTANVLALSLRKPSLATKAYELGLGISRIDRAQNVPELLDQSIFEERAILEFLVYDSISVSDNSGLIEHTVINGEYVPDGGEPITFDVEVSKP